MMIMMMKVVSVAVELEVMLIAIGEVGGYDDNDGDCGVGASGGMMVLVVIVGEVVVIMKVTVVLS